LSEQTWPVAVTFSEVDRRDVNLALVADTGVCAAIARRLDLVSLSRFDASVRLSPWLDGAVLEGDWTAELEQACVVTLEPVPTTLSGRFSVRLLPVGSPNTPQDEPDAVIDPDADDPPDIIEGRSIPVGDYLVEHLALELDPFPRQPGAVFVPPEEPGLITPFAVLKDLAAKNRSDKPG
jgi:uncharacterized metal-binding protein YceD (DUF177 family)